MKEDFGVVSAAARLRAERMPCICERDWCAELLEVFEPDESRPHLVERLRCASGRTFKRVWVSA